MILSFRHKGLAAFWQEGSIAGITPGHAERLQRRLDALNQATRAEDLNVPGFNFHKLRGRPPRWSIHVNGPWCVTFEWQGEDAVRVDYEQYH
ncbi:MAG: type II toxin-antitoxin system RelE/ParE family toxin [Alphaproteobacteria bacterium]|nr:type II toxin-antitoxin system RelE/ParE family toxin [Alphaproteobacteria bacterium]